MNLFEPKHKEELVLRPYQEETVRQVRNAFSKNKKVILCLPTGGGKTATSVHMIKEAVKKGLKCIFCADQINLIDQALEEFQRFGVRCGVIQGYHPCYDPAAPVQICSPQTLARRGIPQFDFAVLDEIHYYHRVFDKILDQGKWVLGMSASPERKGLGEKFDSLVTPVTIQQLMDGGHLVNYTVLAPPTINMENVKTVSGDFDPDETDKRANTAKITGDIVAHWLKYAENRKTAVFCVNIAHAKHVAREFMRNGVSAKSIDCHMRKDEAGDLVKKTMDEFAEDKIKVLVSVSMLTKGFDQADIGCLVIAKPTKKDSMHVQMVGRGLRQYPNSKPCLILDHTANFTRLGWVEDIVFELVDGEKKNSKSKEKNIELLPKACPSCDFLKPANVYECPACGFLPENIRDVETEEGELVELKKKTKKKIYTMEEKKSFLGGLNSYAESKGMKKHPKGFYGWAIYRYQDKFGSKPSNAMDWGMQGEITQEVENFVIHGFIKSAKSKIPKQAVEECPGCHGGDLIQVDVDNMHKVQIKCRSCGRHIKWGKL